MKYTELRSILLNHDKWDEYWRLLAKLYWRTLGFLQLYQELTAMLSGRTLEDIIRDEEKEYLLKTILGGFNAEKAKYSDRALGLFYRKAPGIDIDSDELRKFATRLREGDKPADAGKDIKIGINSNKIVDTIREINKTLYQILYEKSRAEAEVEPINYDAKDPLAALRALKDILDTSKKLLPLYNPVTFILQSFMSTPTFYLQHIYGISFEQRNDQVEPKEEELKETFKTYGIRLQVLLAPDILNKEEKLKRAIIGHVPQSSGWLLHKLICLAYSLHGLIATNNILNKILRKHYKRV